MSYSRRRLILVYRKTRLQELIERFNSWEQAKFYLKNTGSDIEDYQEEHRQFEGALSEVLHVLHDVAPLQRLERELLPTYRFGAEDIVVTLGQDGLVANTLKYLNGQPLIAVNPDPKRYDGRLLPFKVGDLSNIVGEVMAAGRPEKRITFAQARTSDGQTLLGVNDIFVGPKTHYSARYSLEWRERRIEQSSSGIIISTGLGSTGWFKSIVAGALATTAGDTHPLKDGFAWDADYLYYQVREPFASQQTSAELSMDRIDSGKTLLLHSQMPTGGVVFSDGMEADFLAFNSGCTVSIGVAPVSGRLVV